MAHSSVITKLRRINEFLDRDTPLPQQQEARDKVLHSLWHQVLIPTTLKKDSLNFLKINCF